MNKTAMQEWNEQHDDMESRLWAFIDGASDEPGLIERLIKEQADWRQKYAELLAVQQLLKGVELEQPSMRFTKNVMEEIAKLQRTPLAKNYINTKIIWGIAAFFITVIVGFLVYGFSQLDLSGGEEMGKKVIDIKAFDYSLLFNNRFVTVFMMINIVLGLLLLDRYLATKRKKYME